jgi:glycosyltransferase involved in cell wall biosynthesis
LQIIHTIAGTRFEHGGTSRSVPALCSALAQLGLETHLVTGRPASRSVQSNVPLEPVQTHWIEESKRTGRLFTGPAFRRVLKDLVGAAKDASILQDHGLWLPSNHAVACFARKSGTPRIVTPRGMLSPWAMANGKYKKQLFWRLFQRFDLHSATAFHATSEMEAGEIRNLGFFQPIAVVPNGVEFPQKAVEKSAHSRPRMLFLSRIHPKKGLLNLLRAWNVVKPEWDLVIAGPDESGHQQFLQAEARRLGISDSVKFPGAVDDRQKWSLYGTADVFVLPSFSENFGIVIAEAMSAGLPAITTVGTPWSQLPDRKIGWWVEPTVESLASVIGEVTTTPVTILNQMGNRASNWVQSEYRWNAIASKMLEFYKWILCGGQAPEFVISD